jgi:hypothetical protein
MIVMRYTTMRKTAKAPKRDAVTDASDAPVTAMERIRHGSTAANALNKQTRIQVSKCAMSFG